MLFSSSRITSSNVSQNSPFKNFLVRRFQSLREVTYIYKMIGEREAGKHAKGGDSSMHPLHNLRSCSAPKTALLVFSAILQKLNGGDVQHRDSRQTSRHTPSRLTLGQHSSARHSLNNKLRCRPQRGTNSKALNRSFLAHRSARAKCVHATP